MADDPAVHKRVFASTEKLTAASTKLNAASDELWEPIGSLEETLKRLNLGIESWVKFKEYSDPQTGSYSGRKVGYAKVGHKWGLVLRTYRGNEFADEPDDYEEWFFNEAPRSLRIEAVDHLPALIESLVEEANTTADRIREKIGSAREIADAMLEARRAHVRTASTSRRNK